jgi:hypothetical protein
MTRRTLSLGAGAGRDLLLWEDRSAIDIVVIPSLGLLTGIPAAGEQMMMRPEDPFRLKAP